MRGNAMRVTLLAVVLSLGLSSVFANVICDTKRHIGVNDTDVSIELNDTIGFFIKTFCYARVQDGGVAAEQCRSALLAKRVTFSFAKEKTWST